MSLRFILCVGFALQVTLCLCSLPTVFPPPCSPPRPVTVCIWGETTDIQYHIQAGHEPIPHPSFCNSPSIFALPGGWHCCYPLSLIHCSLPHDSHPRTFERVHRKTNGGSENVRFLPQLVCLVPFLCFQTLPSFGCKSLTISLHSPRSLVASVAGTSHGPEVGFVKPFSTRPRLSHQGRRNDHLPPASR